MAEEPIETIRVPAIVGGETSVQLLLKLQPKLLRGQLQLIGQADERTIRELFTRYDLTVVALPYVQEPVDQFEGTVDIDPQQAAERIMLAEERHLPRAPVVPEETFNVQTTPPTTNRRQQAAAILIATIALLTSLLQLLK